ncbi:hypothetical protein ACOME3_003500 [Neoechinorhynchus agilis]
MNANRIVTEKVTLWLKTKIEWHLFIDKSLSIRDEGFYVIFKGQNAKFPLETSAENLLEFVFDQSRKFALKQAGIKKNFGKMIDLTDKTFDREIKQSPPGTMWFVEFFAPWCGHCQRLAPEWKRAASLVAEKTDKARLAAVDATKEHSVTGRYRIQGFPTIKIFGQDNPNVPRGDYEGPRSAEGIRDWIVNYVGQNVPPKIPEVLELTSQEMFDQECKAKTICVIAFLPDLLDCQSECRNNYLRLLKGSAQKYARQEWGWLWSSALSHSKLEDILEVGGSGFPAMVALASKKKAYATFRGAFSESGVDEFLRDLSYGRGVSGEIKKEVDNLTKVSEWDGKDATMPVQESDEIQTDEHSEL